MLSTADPRPFPESKIIYCNGIQIFQHGKNLVNIYLLDDITDDAIYFLEHMLFVNIDFSTDTIETNGHPTADHTYIAKLVPGVSSI